MKAYYNENDEFAAAWLRELIAAGLIMDGDVDERSIKDVQPGDIAGYRQCHFFAGIGGWPLALEIAGWPDDVPVWTGSCPCQPYSAAGKRKGNADERNLWPEMFRLIRECRPESIFGEQVASAIRHGWLDGISADLEGEGYAVGACVLGAHSVNAPHIRQRLWWLADAGHGESGPRSRRGLEEAKRVKSGIDVAECCHQGPTPNGRIPNAGCTPGSAEYRNDAGERTAGPSRNGAVAAESSAGPEWLGHADCRRLQQDNEQIEAGASEAGSGLGNPSGAGLQERDSDGRIQRGAIGSAPWQAFELAVCRDGKARRVAPGVPLLAHGIPNRVAQLRGLGNAIVPQVAAEFVRAYLDTSSNSTSEAAHADQ